MVVELDVVDNAKIRITKQTLEIRRRAIVSQIPIDCSSGTDPSILLKCIGAAAVSAGMPAQYSLYPDALYPAVLEDYNLDSVRSVNTVVVELIYRMPLSVDLTGDTIHWTQNESIQTYQTETWGTANGSKGLSVYYKQGLGTGTGGAVPSTAHERIGKARKWKKYKVLRMRGRCYLQTWLDLKATFEPAELCLNSDTWGGFSRGKWIYMGYDVTTPAPASLAPSTVIIADVEMRFLYDPDAHYPLLVYLNERREHPKDAVSEQALRGLGLPSVNNLLTTNGKTLASIYGETTFSDKFPFTPL